MKKIYQTYLILLAVQTMSSLLQLFFPIPESPGDSSGLLILRNFYVFTTLIYLIFTTIYGAYLLIISNLHLQNKLIGRVISFLLIFSFPLFFALFFELAGFLRRVFGYMENGLIRLHLDAVFLCLLFVFLQLSLIVFFHRKYKENSNVQVK
jgi:hypothetical protein